MKSSLVALAALLLSTSIVLGDPGGTIGILKSPALSAEELKRVPFSGRMTPYPGKPLAVELHNPFRDKRISGIVIQVESNGAEGKRQTLELFVPVDGGPLQSVQLQLPVFNSKELLEKSPVITLKEVHHRPLVPEGFLQDSIIQSPTLSAEELKRVPFAGQIRPGGMPLGVELHNPFRDKRIQGIVVLVQFKSADGKEQSREILLSVACDPLQSHESYWLFANAAEVGDSPVITLKEVHVEPTPEPDK